MRETWNSCQTSRKHWNFCFRPLDLMYFESLGNGCMMGRILDFSTCTVVNRNSKLWRYLQYCWAKSHHIAFFWQDLREQRRLLRFWWTFLWPVTCWLGSYPKFQEKSIQDGIGGQVSCSFSWFSFWRQSSILLRVRSDSWS